MLLLADIIKTFEKEIPLSLQDSWDKSGLQVGSRSQKIKNVLFAYDACHEVLRFAAKNKIHLIVTHHPLQLKDYKNIDLDSYEGEIIRLAIKHGIAIYTAHTNHDASKHSLNRHYAKRLNLSDLKPLVPNKEKPYLKLIVFVPESHTTLVLESVFAAGAGHIGHYSSCSFRTKGIGTFKGDASTHPFLGKREILEQADENRVEIIVPKEKIKNVLSAMLKTHPYEEVAYDIIPLEIESPHGSGLYGKLPQPISMQQATQKIKKIFGVKKFRLAGKMNQKIKTIGLCTGSGASLLTQAIKAGVDLFITGDVKYHAAVEALRNDVCLVDVGHFYSEISSVSLLKTLFKNLFGSQLHLAEYSRLKDALKEV